MIIITVKFFLCPFLLTLCNYFFSFKVSSTSASSQMEQQGLDLPPHLKQLKTTGEIYYMVVCQDTGHQTARAVTAQRTSKELSPVTAPGHSLESFQAAMPGGNRVQPGGLFCWGRQCWKSRKAKMMRVQRAEYQSGETRKERKLQECAENACSSSASAVSTNV